MLVARLRNNLRNLCPELVDQIRIDGVHLDAATLTHYLVVRVSRTCPRSAVVPWHLRDEVVEKVAMKVAAEFVVASAGRLT
jgi:hypothetical protein